MLLCRPLTTMCRTRRSFPVAGAALVVGGAAVLGLSACGGRAEGSVAGVSTHLVLTGAVLIVGALLTAACRMYTAHSKEIAESEERYRLLAEHATDQIARHAPDGRFRYVSPASTTLLGYDPTELEGHLPTDFLHPDDVDRARAVHRRILRETDITTHECRMRHADGHFVWLETTARAVRDHRTRRILEIITVTRDISARKAAQQALAASEAELRGVFQAMRDVVLVLDRGGRYLKIPATDTDSLLYLPPQQLLGRTVHEVLPRAQADAVCATIRQALDQQVPVYTEYNLPINGTTVWFTGVVSPLTDDSVVWVARDVTARVHTEAALRQAHATLATLVRVSPFAIVTIDMHSVVTGWNSAAESIFGWTAEEVLGKPLPIIPADRASEFTALRDALLDKQGVVDVELERQRKDGTRITVSLSATAMRDETGRAREIVAFIADVTERRRLEAQLRQSQKMEAVGQLAGGVAHDFNNLLTVITAHCEFLREALPPGTPTRNDVDEIYGAARRAATLTGQLLAFSRKQLIKPCALNLNETVLGLEQMLVRLIGEDIDIHTVLSPDLDIVSADPGQIEQLLINLAVNARDAMPAGGTLTISTANHVEGRSNPLHDGPLPHGAYVVLTVQDMGCGMDAATQARIFEPFFTTKPPGSGTGLGLSTVYGIVQQSGGYIWVDSEPGHGTTFRIYLPRIAGERPAAPVIARTDRAPAPSPAPQASGSVLLVEDEASVRHLMRRVLEQQGYSVLEAENGAAAVPIASAHRRDLDLVVTDLIMPEMNGRALAGELATICPDVPILYTSGYTDDEIIRRGLLDATTAFLEKPFTTAGLLTAVERALKTA